MAKRDGQTTGNDRLLDYMQLLLCKLKIDYMQIDYIVFARNNVLYPGTFTYPICVDSQSIKTRWSILLFYTTYTGLIRTGKYHTL